MSRLSCRGSIVGAAVAIALLSSRPAGAQGVIAPRPIQQTDGAWNDLINGVQYDRANQAKAEHQLRSREAKLRRDAERGNADAVARDAFRIYRLKYRIEVDQWLIQQNTCQNPGYYPVRLDSSPPASWYRDACSPCNTCRR